jgi:hypothetical protein
MCNSKDVGFDEQRSRLDFSAFTSAKGGLIGKWPCVSYLGHVDDTTASGADEPLTC